MPSSLLADLAVMMSSSPEDVATRALELILFRSVAAREATQRLFDVWRDVPGPAVTRWVSQVGGADDARTDLQGFDEYDQTVAIFENKFWAGLTDNQPATYLSRLPREHGVLVFLVPATRVPLVKHEVAERLRRRDGAAPDFRRVGESEVSSLATGHTLVVASWSVLLRSISTSLLAAQDTGAQADLQQLEGLVFKMERDGFRPLTQAQITGDTAHLVLQLGQLVDGAVQQLLTRPFADKKGLKATAGQGWYGHYLRMHGYGCQLAMSAWWWAAHGISPIWLRVASRDWKFPEELRRSLRDAIDDPAWIQEDHDSATGFWLPIRLLEGRDREVVIRDMLRQLECVAVALSRHSLTPTADEGQSALPPSDEQVVTELRDGLDANVPPRDGR